MMSKSAAVAEQPQQHHEHVDEVEIERQRAHHRLAAGVALTGLVAWFTYQMAVVVTNATGAITGLTPFGQTLFGR
jgi:hypothetical protein